MDLWQRSLEAGDRDALAGIDVPLDKLAGYYGRLQDLARGYEKDPDKLAEQLRIVRGWQETVERLGSLVVGSLEK